MNGKKFRRVWRVLLAPVWHIRRLAKGEAGPPRMPVRFKNWLPAPWIADGFRATNRSRVESINTASCDFTHLPAASGQVRPTAWRFCEQYRSGIFLESQEPVARPRKSFREICRMSKSIHAETSRIEDIIQNLEDDAELHQALPSVRYFQIHFEHLHDLLHEIRRDLADLRQRLGQPESSLAQPPAAKTAWVSIPGSAQQRRGKRS